MPIAHVNGINLYYEDTGSGPPLVWVHGFACGIRSWDPQVRELSGSRRLIAYDVRGFGLSEAPQSASSYSQSLSVADLAALLEHLRVERAVVGGLSMGGNIALNFAIDQPQRVAALVIADTGAGSDNTQEWVAGAERYAQACDRGGVEAFADLACANPLFARYIEQGPDRERFIRSCLMTHRARGIAHTAREVLSKRPTVYSLEAHLRELRIPTLLIVGEHDTPCVKVHEYMARTIPGAHSVVLPGIGHLSNLEAPAEFNVHVRRFLDEAVPAGSRRDER
jgi:pimeloyl-ACP methyl ester carboxylesterase